jgi:uncharacterized membrane protein HdeD (DUF308 family)
MWRVAHRDVTRPKEVRMLVTNPLAPKSWSRELVRSVSSGWWLLLLSGIVSIVAGGIILLVDWSLNDLALFLGVLFIVRGVFNMLSLPLDGSVRGWAVALGLLEVGVGIAVLVWPDPTLLVIAAFIGWWVLFSGVMTVAGSISARRRSRVELSPGCPPRGRCSLKCPDRDWVRSPVAGSKR